MMIPTKQFKVQGKMGKFSVSKNALKMVDGTEKFEAFWNGGQKGHAFVYAGSRQDALMQVLAKAA